MAKAWEALDGKETVSVLGGAALLTMMIGCDAVRRPAGTGTIWGWPPFPNRKKHVDRHR